MGHKGKWVEGRTDLGKGDISGQDCETWVKLLGNAQRRM